MGAIRKLINSLYAQKLNEEEIKLLEDFFKKYQGKEGEIMNKLTEKTEIKQKGCIAFDVSPYLCHGDINTEISYSHIVPANQFKSFEKLHGFFLNYSQSLHNILKSSEPSKANIKSGGFVGFCSKCEKKFQTLPDNPHGIDATYKLTNTHLLHNLYRYLGKEIKGLELFIPFWENISKEIEPERTRINKEGFNLYLKNKKMNTNIEEFIEKNICDLMSLKSLFFELSLVLRQQQKYKTPLSNFPSLFIKKEVILNDKDFPIIGQSGVFLPICFEEYQSHTFLYVQFILDLKKGKTNCYILVSNNICFQKVFNENFEEMSELQKGKFMLALAINYKQHLYFNKDGEKIIKNIEITLNKISLSTDNVETYLINLINHIKNN